MQTSKHLKNMPVTLALITINTIVFVVIAVRGHDFLWGNPDDLLHAGANYWPFTVQQQEYWRLFTSMFLHAGIWHLITNMLGLLIAGLFLEPVVRGPKLCIIYFSTGLIADYASIWFHRDVVAVGASGAIFGVYGAFLALLTTPLFKTTTRIPFLVFIALFVGLNIIAAFFVGEIDNVAHISGFISGIICGFLLYPTLSDTDGSRLPG
ncbi:rhomboid family intramembrane serine protease [Chitinophaga sp. Hz27]|uniref:rhomboid family intramembrane serine protease n=1 Tax=Chitinophaga sp. Hz27 TaxID=3347169 RepID=UPI0035D6A6AB